jgi:RNA polymerase sigma factor (sigma-70 family)
LAVLGNPADAEDVTQTTFMNAYRAIQSGERPRKPANWLRTIAHNVCRQRYRQAARRPREVVEFDELRHPLVAEEPEGPTPADITRALQALPFTQRSALVMRELEGRRQAEIANELGVSESAVETLLFRARRAMREQLEESITCGEAARAISRQLDRSLPRAERGALRAHLRECEECATFARKARAQRGAMKSLGAVPLPASLLSWVGGQGTAGIGAAVGVKLAAGVAAVALVAGAADVTIHSAGPSPKPPRSGAEVAKQSARPAPVVDDRAAVPHTRLAAGARSPSRAAAHRAPARAASTAPAKKHPGAAVRAHGTPAQSNGQAVRAHGSPPRSSGQAVRAHGSPPPSQGRAIRAHGQPAKPPKTPPAHPATPPAHGHSADPKPANENGKAPKP